MSPESRPSDLLMRWQEARRRGQPLSPEEVCRDCPEHLSELRRRIEELDRTDGPVPPEEPLSGSTLKSPTLPDLDPPRASEARTEPSPPPGGPGGSSPALPVSDYELLGELGRGGMGVVYRARQCSLNRLVAVKMLRGDVAVGPGDLSRFRAEAEAVARLQHPNIVQIHDLGEVDGRPYFSMELIAGGSLARRLGGQPLPPRQAAQLAETLARAIHTAHRHGIIHRDLKPSNILLAGDPDAPIARCIPKVSDFGLAKRIDARKSLTVSGSVMGTPAYMAPEQAAGRTRELQPACDVYGLGAILYELLTGQAPFSGGNMMETLERVQTQEPVAPTRLVPRVPRDLETICLKCLEKEPRQRYASAVDLADDLARFLAGDLIHARPIARWQRAVRWLRARPLTSLLAGVSTATLAGILIGSGWSYPLAAACAAALGLLAASWWYNARLQAALDETRAQNAVAQRHVERLHLLMETTRDLVAAGSHDELLRLLGETAARLANADRATIYLVDAARGELCSRVSTGRGVGEIRLSLGEGIAGTVGRTGQTINLPDAEADPRFHPGIDRRTGYKTRNMLTLPMMAPGGRIVGVFQLLNKRGGPFTVEDIEVLTLLASSASVVVEKAQRLQGTALP